MTSVTRYEGHLLAAAIRVLSHRLDRAPRPDEVADLIEVPEAVLRVWIAHLSERGIVALVESAFDSHVELRDHRAIDDLEDAGGSSELSDDLAEFDRRKQEEAEKMSRLFDDGDHERRRGEKLDEMDKALKDFHQRKPRNPFGED